MTQADLSGAIRTVAEEALAIAALLQEAEEVQWSPAPVPKPRDDTTERSKGGHGDPTPSIVLDARRLAVREAVTTSERLLLVLVKALRHVRRGLEASLGSWNGSA